MVGYCISLRRPGPFRGFPGSRQTHGKYSIVSMGFHGFLRISKDLLGVSKFFYFFKKSVRRISGGFLWISMDLFGLLRIFQRFLRISKDC